LASSGSSSGAHIIGDAAKAGKPIPNDLYPTIGDAGPRRHRTQPLPFLRAKTLPGYHGFRYPDSFTAGTLGCNTLEPPASFGVRTRSPKAWQIYERLRFTLRFDVNNPYKYHSFDPPNSTFNSTDPSSFGTFNGTRGSFSDIGAGRWHGIMVFPA
jgi:hypothetical protein